MPQASWKPEPWQGLWSKLVGRLQKERGQYNKATNRTFKSKSCSFGWVGDGGQLPLVSTAPETNFQSGRGLVLKLHSCCTKHALNGVPSQKNGEKIVSDLNIYLYNRFCDRILQFD